jgi:hypothetical protein
LAAVFSPARSVSGRRRVIDRVVGFSCVKTARSAFDQST